MKHSWENLRNSKLFFLNKLLMIWVVFSTFFYVRLVRFRLVSVAMKVCWSQIKNLSLQVIRHNIICTFTVFDSTGCFLIGHSLFDVYTINQQVHYSVSLLIHSTAPTCFDVCTSSSGSLLLYVLLS
jgi:hypothetical protein